MAPGFRTTVWDPTLIVGQILCIQSSFYSSESLLMLLWATASTYKPSLDHFFTLQTIKPMTVIQLISVLMSAGMISIIVGRARQCLDFTCTLHFIHLIITCFYNSAIPSQLTWWLLQLVSVSLCTLLSEYLCMRWETMEIPIRIPPSSSKPSEDRELLLVSSS